MNQNSTPSGERRLVLALALTFGIVVFDRNAMGFLGPFVARDLQLSNTQLGMVSAALALTWAIASAIVGAVSDALGRRKQLLIAAVLLFSVCSLGSGLAAGFGSLLAFRLLMGLSEGGILPISQALSALSSNVAHRGRNAGIVQNTGSFLIGAFLAPLVLVPIANHFGWRNAFYFAGVPGLLCAFLLARIVREPPAPNAAQAVARNEAIPASKMEMFSYRNTWLCILISGSMVAWLFLGWVFLPVYYVNQLHIAPDTMGSLMAVLGLSGAVFSFLVPGLSDRLGRKPVLIAFCAIGALVPLAALFAHQSLWPLGVLVFIGFSASGAFPLFMAIVPFETVSAKGLGTAVGVIMGLGEMTGGVLGPYVAGRAADSYGLAAPMVMMAGCALAAAFYALFLRETAPAVVAGRALRRDALASG